MAFSESMKYLKGKRIIYVCNYDKQLVTWDFPENGGGVIRRGTGVNVCILCHMQDRDTLELTTLCFDNLREIYTRAHEQYYSEFLTRRCSKFAIIYVAENT